MVTKYKVKQSEFETFLNQNYSQFTEELGAWGTLAKCIDKKLITKENEIITINDPYMNRRYGKWRDN